MLGQQSRSAGEVHGVLRGARRVVTTGQSVERSQDGIDRGRANAHTRSAGIEASTGTSAMMYRTGHQPVDEVA